MNITNFWLFAIPAAAFLLFLILTIPFYFWDSQSQLKLYRNINVVFTILAVVVFVVLAVIMLWYMQIPRRNDPMVIPSETNMRRYSQDTVYEPMVIPAENNMTPDLRRRQIRGYPTPLQGNTPTSQRYSPQRFEIPTEVARELNFGRSRPVLPPTEEYEELDTTFEELD